MRKPPKHFWLLSVTKAASCVTSSPNGSAHSHPLTAQTGLQQLLLKAKYFKHFFFTFPRECPKQHQNKGTRCWCLYNTHSSEMFYQDQNICRWVRDSTMVCIKGRPENYISGYRICDGERRYHPETTDSSVPHCSCSGGPGAAQRLFSLSAARLRSARDGQTG